MAALCDDTGASAVEYGLIITAVAAVVVAVVVVLGGQVQSMFGSSCDTINSSVQTPGQCGTP